jgi:hypothetical protein
MLQTVAVSAPAATALAGSDGGFVKGMEAMVGSKQQCSRKVATAGGTAAAVAAAAGDTAAAGEKGEAASAVERAVAAAAAGGGGVLRGKTAVAGWRVVVGFKRCQGL